MTTIPDHSACDFLLFGSKGDLAARKLLPALYQLEKSGLLHPDTRIIGLARDDLSTESYVSYVKQQIENVSTQAFDTQRWNHFAKRLAYVSLDFTKQLDFEKLLQFIDTEIRTPISYLATPPALYPGICAGLATAGLCDRPARVILEKPIGHDLKSSQAINYQVGQYFTEEQIYRIDHYLGKETVLNLLALRFANAMFSFNWDRNGIDHVQISVAEEVGVESRWSYYDDAGQLRDMVQNHLLQILSLIAMEPPASLSATDLREEKLKVLKALRPIDSSNEKQKTVRGQYTSGQIRDKAVPGYLEEEGGTQKSCTETFVALKVEIDNWRWAGVPFYLRTGKRMAKKRSEVHIVFKSQPINLFHKSCQHLPPNKLVIRLQPDEGIEIHMMNKLPGLEKTMQLQSGKLDLSFDDAFKNERIADAYERLLLEAMLGNQYLFVHRDEVEQAWRWVDTIQTAWKNSAAPPLNYQAGSLGPEASDDLMTADHRSWDE